MPEQKRGFTGVWIPAEIWKDERLNIIEKVLIAEIYALDKGNDDKGCFASNAYFAKFFSRSEPTISIHISNLKELGYVEETGFNGRKRLLKAHLCPIIRQPLEKPKGRPNENLNHISKNISKNSSMQSAEKSDILEPEHKPKKEENKKIPHFRELTDCFFDLYKKRMQGVKPAWRGKETKLLKTDIYRMMGTGDDWHEILKAAMELFMKDKVKSVTDFTAEAGYSYGVFHSCLDKILAAMLEKAK